jgi:spore coat protein U-like protein
MKKILSLVSLIILGLVFSGLTYAGQTTGTLQVSANVAGVCTVTTSPVNFGNTDGIQEVYANGDVTVNCPVDLAYNIALDAGQHYLRGWRRVMNSSYWITYELDRTGMSTDEWGDVCPGGAGTYPYGICRPDIGNGANQAHTVYGTLYPYSGIPGNLTLTDTVTVTVLF